MRGGEDERNEIQNRLRSAAGSPVPAAAAAAEIMVFDLLHISADSSY